MKITGKHFNERSIVGGTLYQRARFSAVVTSTAMQQFDRQRDELLTTFGFTSLVWVRWEKVGLSTDKPEYAAHYDVIKGETEYEFSMLGHGDLTERAEALLTWLSAVGRIEAAAGNRIKSNVVIDPHAVTGLPVVTEPFSVIFGIGYIS